MTLSDHLSDLLRFLVVLLGPLPVSAILAVATVRGRAAPLAHGLLVTLTTWCVLEVSLVLVLGMLGCFDRPRVIGAEAALFIPGMIGLVHEGSRCAIGRARATSQRLESIEFFLVGTLVVIGLALLARVALTPVTDYDSLAYHLPAMVTWYQRHSLVELEGFGMAAYYPFSWDLLSALFVLPFEEDFLVAAPNLIAWAIFGLATYGASRELGARRAPALSVCLLLLTMPIVRNHVNTLHVDLALAAFFLAALYFVQSRRSGPWGVNGTLAFAATGMVAGVKTSGPVYAVLIALAAISGQILAQTDDDVRPRPSTSVVTASVVVVAAAILVATFWYARNMLAVGNPLGAVSVEFRGRTLFPGFLRPADVRRSTLLALFHVTDVKHWRMLGAQLWSQLGLGFPALVVAALAIRPRLLAGPQRDRTLRFLRSAALLVVTAFAYCVTPYSADTEPGHGRLTPWFGQGLRYAFPFLGLSAVCGGVGASSLVQGERLLAAAVLAVGLGQASNVMVVAAAGLLLSGWAAWRLAGRLSRAVLGRGVVLAVCAAVVVGASLWLRHSRDAERLRRYGAIGPFIAHHVETSETIGYSMTDRAYLLYGKSLDRPLRLAPAARAGITEWLADIRRREITLLAVGPVPPRFAGRPELGWLCAGDGPFRPIYGRDPRTEMVLYRIEAP